MVDFVILFAFMCSYLFLCVLICFYVLLFAFYVFLLAFYMLIFDLSVLACFKNNYV